MLRPEGVGNFDAAPAGDAQSLGVQDEILDPRPQPQHDVGTGAHRLRQCRLQVGAVDRPIGRAVAALGLGAERDSRKPAAARGLDRDRLGREHVGAQTFAETERDQDSRGVGRELDAGAGLFQPLGLLQQCDAESGSRQHQRRAQPPDTSADDDDIARRRHGPGAERSDRFGQGAGLWPCGMGIERRIVPIQRRAVRTDDFLVAPHVEKDVRMIVRRPGADAHELACADLDHRDAGIVMKVRNDVIGHDFASISGMSRRTIAAHTLIS